MSRLPPFLLCGAAALGLALVGCGSGDTPAKTAEPAGLTTAAPAQETLPAVRVNKSPS